MDTRKSNVELNIEKATNLRIKLDSFEKAIASLPRSRYNSLALTRLETGRMYIGEILILLGHEYPYEKTKTATTAKEIVPAADISTDTVELGDNEIVNLNLLREKLDEATKTFLDIVFGDKGITSIRLEDKTKVFVRDTSIAEAYRGIKEARMFLGKRLGELRDGK